MRQNESDENWTDTEVIKALQRKAVRGNLLDDAAKKIKRLRAALQEITDNRHDEVAGVLMQKARRALEPK